jgi:hypothetical protein
LIEQISRKDRTQPLLSQTTFAQGTIKGDALHFTLRSLKGILTKTVTAVLFIIVKVEALSNGSLSLQVSHHRGGGQYGRIQPDDIVCHDLLHYINILLLLFPTGLALFPKVCYTEKEEKSIGFYTRRIS